MKMIALCGKSGAGKDTILSALLANHSSLFEKKISYTTRSPREGEKDGVDYHFISREEFFNKILNEEMIEADDFNGEVYGTAINSLVENKINLGVFTPEGIEILTSINELEVLPVYLEVSDRERIKRVLDRDTEATIDSIYERYKQDRQEFDGVELIPDLLSIDNTDEDISSIVNTIKLLAENMIEL